MSNKQNKKFIDETPLDDYEKELEEFINKGEFISVKNFDKRKKELQGAAKNFLELQKNELHCGSRMKIY